MKRKYKIEIGIATSALLIVLFITIPQFLKLQTQTQPPAMQQFVEDVVAYLANNDNKEIYATFDKVRRRYASNSYICFTHDGKVYLKEHFYYFDQSVFLRAMNQIKNPRWQSSDVYFAVAKTHMRASTEYDSTPCDKNEFDKNPYVISCFAMVGDNHSMKDRGKHGASHRNFHGPDGYMYTYIEELIPYDATNGITSYGEFYCDTSTIWPKQKAVVMDPPPEEPQ